MAKTTFDLSKSHEVLIERLMNVCELKTKKDVVENALLLLGWAATEVSMGRKIASFDDNMKIYREIQTTALQGASQSAELAKIAAIAAAE